MVAAPNGEQPPKRQRSDINRRRGPQLLPHMQLYTIGSRLFEISAARHFARSDFVGGGGVTPSDWADLCTSSWELLE